MDTISASARKKNNKRKFKRSRNRIICFDADKQNQDGRFGG